MVITPQTIADLQRGFSLRFEQGFASMQAGRDSFWAQKAELVSTPGIEFNVNAFLLEMPVFRKWTAARKPKRLASAAYLVKNEDYEFSYSVARNDIKYDRVGVYGPHASRAGVAAALWKDQMLELAQKNGKTLKCVDGQFFYDTDHPVDLSGVSSDTFQNLWTTMPLTIDNFVTRYAYMSSIKDANGEPFGAVPDVLEVGPGLIKAGRDIVTAEILASAIKNVAGAENVGGAGQSNTMRGIVDLWVNPRLESGVWNLHHTRQMKPFIVQVESEPSGLEARMDDTDPHVWEQNEFLFGSRATGAAAYGLPQLSTRCEVA